MPEEKSIQENKWINIRVRRTTLKRLRIDKAQRELGLYDDLINLALDELERLE